MRIRFETSLNHYKQKVEPLLLKKEACNNLMLGIMNRLEQDDSVKHSNACLGLVELNDKPVYAFMQTPPNNWILADVDNTGDDAIRQIARFVHEKAENIPGVIGPPDKANIMIKELEHLRGSTSAVHMKQLIYQLDRVNAISYAGGNLTEATPNDHQLMKNWLMQFGEQANEPMSAERAGHVAEVFIEKRSLYLWKVDDNAVSMVNQSRQTKNGTTINAVFTPDEHKGKGYATAAVAKLSERLLQEGFQFCCLFTDAANPTSNNIYKKIGYYEVGTSVVYKLADNKR